ncbi:helix-turn-helix transcriptional regulator [Cellulosilyticum sp. ST5]|uniref:helix-turn-helix domain-containing protein n=1 Tax=Cellulosilyticum sp. ST5 TaxID=3055805 RepID=UPI00397755DD
MIGEKIKTRLKELGLTQKDLAITLNISPSTLSGYITGYRTPDINTISMIANALKVKPSYFLDDNENLNKKDKKDIAKDVASIMTKIKRKEDGPAYYNGVEMDQEDADLFEQALEFALRSIKIENKEKYTPKKYRK